MNNQPSDLGELIAFKLNDCPVQAEFESSDLIGSPVTVEVWSGGVLFDDLTPSVADAVISFTVPKEMLQTIDPVNSMIYIKFGDVYEYSIRLRTTLNGSISQPRFRTISAPSAGTIRISTYSDFASVEQAKEYRDQVIVIRDSVNDLVYTPNLNGAAGDGVADDTTEVASTFQEGKDVTLTGDYKVTAWENKYGVNTLGNGRILKPITGGSQQLNTYARAFKETFGQDDLWFFHNKLRTRATGTPVTIRFKGDSTTAGDATTAGFKVDDLIKAYADYYGIPDITTVNNGVSGSHIGQWFSTLNAEITAGADLWVIRPGINDPYTTFNRTRDQFLTDLDSYIATIRASKPWHQLSILLMAPNSVSDTPGNRDERWFESIIGGMKEVAAKYKCAWFDTYGKFQNSRGKAGYSYDNPYSDGRAVHPKDDLNTIIMSGVGDLVFPQLLRAKISVKSLVYNPPIGNKTPLNADLPDTYPYGVSLMDARTENGFPIQGQLLTMRNAAVAFYAVQTLTSIVSTTFLEYRRTAYFSAGSRTWTPWTLTPNTVVRDQLTNESDLPDTYPVGVTIDDARPANGWPFQGQLLTTKNISGSYCVQRIYSAVSQSPISYERQSYYNGSTRSWTPWYISGGFRTSVAFDPPALNPGEYATVNATITNIPAGKVVQAAYSINITADIVLTAWVSAANTVTARFHNIGAAPVNLAAGTVYFTADH